MSDRVFSFSVKANDKDNLALVLDLKDRSSRTGTTFSFIMLEALREYRDNRNVKKEG
jgi:hypothetical protein